MKKVVNGVKILAIFCALLISYQSNAQTSGLIYKTALGAGKAVLDPDGNGYTSKTTNGFLSDDIANSEIGYTPIPQWSSEPSSDLATGPSCGFTDFVDNGTQKTVFVYKDANNNLLFRFRLANTANNSKGYSILVDADQKFGATGTSPDPNYVSGNPGFEFEIVLESNFRVALYGVDGTTTPTFKNSISYDTACQKSIASNIYTGATCGNKYFYDFYIPFSYITRAFPSYTTSTPLRMVANTVIAPKSALQGPISDIGGIQDNQYSTEAAWSTMVNEFYPTSFSNLNSLPAKRSQAPAITNTSISYGSSSTVNVTGTFMSGSSSGTIYLYKQGNGTPVCSTSVSGSSGGSFSTSLSSCTTFNTGDLVYATLLESSTSESPSSNVVSVTATSCTGGRTAAPTSVKLSQGEKSIGGSMPAGATVYIYHDGSIVTTIAAATQSTTTFSYSPQGSGSTAQFQFSCGQWWATAVSGSQCESPISTIVTPSKFGGTSCPTYSSSPIPSFTSKPYYSSSSVAGSLPSAPASSITTVTLYKNNVAYTTTTATNSSTSAATISFSFGTISGLKPNDTLSLSALTTGNYTTTTGTDTAIIAIRAPVITNILVAGYNIVSGTSVSPSGTTITLYRKPSGGSFSQVSTTTVGTNGTWSYTWTGNTFTSNAQWYATATYNGKTSGNSNTVTVLSAASSVVVTITTANPLEGVTSITGTLSSSSTGTVTLYEDGYAVGTTSVSATTGWTVSGLSTSTSSANYIFAGDQSTTGLLTATFTATGSAEGAASASVPVQCTQPSALTSTSVYTKNYQVCTGSKAYFKVSGSEAGIVYTPVKYTSTSTYYGTSTLGTGDTITIASFATTTPGRDSIKVEAKKIGLPCSTILTDSAAFRVDCNATYNVASSKASNAYALGDSLATVSDPNGRVTSAVLTSGSLPPGTSLNAVTGAIYVTNLASLTNGSWSPVIKTTDYYGGTTTNTVNLSILAPLPIKLLYFKAALEAGKVDLKWSTLTEENNDHFTVERSSNGYTFDELFRVAGAGTSNVRKDYSGEDAAPLLGTSYYRLRQTDFNGNYDLSGIQVIHNNTEGSGNTQLQIFPNPSGNGQTKISVSEIPAASYIVSVTNQWGQQLDMRTLPLSSNTYRLSDLLPGLNLKPGIYNLRIQSGAVILNQSFIIFQ